MDNLRTGYTTGTCAAAAAKAAVSVLCDRQIDDQITIELPDGSIVTGVNSPLMHAASSAVLNGLKQLAEIL